MVTVLRNIGPLLLWIITYTLILVIWGWLFFRLYGGLNSRKWLRVSAKIVRSRVKRETFFGFGVPQRLTYPEIVYAYLVNGKWYASKNLSFSLFRRNTSQLVENFPTHALVQVFYHPLFPRLSVLEPGLPAREILLLSMFFLWTSILVVAGCWLIVGSLL